MKGMIKISSYLSNLVGWALFILYQAASVVLVTVTAVPFALIWLGTAGALNCWDWPPRFKRPVATIPNAICIVGMLLMVLGQDYYPWILLPATTGYLFFIFPPPDL